MLDAPDADVAGRVFNVGTGHATSVNEIAAGLIAVLAPGTRPEYAPAQAGEMRNAIADPSALAAALGWTPRRGVDFADVVAFWRARVGDRNHGFTESQMRSVSIRELRVIRVSLLLLPQVEDVGGLDADRRGVGEAATRAERLVERAHGGEGAALVADVLHVAARDDGEVEAAIRQRGFVVVLEARTNAAPVNC